MEKKVFDIENLFTEKNEREGVWFEPVFEDVHCGVEFLLIGINSEEAGTAMAHFDELADKIRDSKDEDSVKEQKLRELDAERVAALTKGIRSTDGSELQYEGKKLDDATLKEVAKELYLNSPDIKLACVDFVLKSSNFMKIKRA
jgi:hypothetical protein